MNKDDRFHTVKEVAAELRVRPKTIWKWIGDGKVNAKKIGRAFLIEDEEYRRILVSLDRRRGIV